MQGFQRLKILAGVGQTINTGITSAQLFDQIGGLAGRQQADMLSQQCRAKADDKVVTVATQIQNMPPRRQQ